MTSYLEANGRERLQKLLDVGSFEEFLPPQEKISSPHLEQLGIPAAFDDGVAIGRGRLKGEKVFVASEEGAFLGGGVGEVHGAKLVGLLKKAQKENPKAVLLLLESGGVRLHEANAGLIAVSETMRAVVETRMAGIPVIVLIGGSNGCFGGTGIVAQCANLILMSEEGRTSMSGPEVIETARGVEEFDSQDHALVWRTTGGKQRYLLEDCLQILPDNIDDFREAAFQALNCYGPITLEGMLEENKLLADRIAKFGKAKDALEIWAKLGIQNPEQLPMLEIAEFLEIAKHHRAGDLK